MARKEKKYHYIYKTTNLKNGKFYVGMHSTDNLNDGYLGSGVRLRRAIRKYGKDNFKIEILEWHKSRKDLIVQEQFIINNTLLKDCMCMNLIKGGTGIDSDRAKILNKYSQISQSNLMKHNPEWVKSKSLKCSKATKFRFEMGLIKNFKYDWTGKHHTIDTKIKIGKANSIKQLGKNNSQFGTCWITNGIENKKIKKQDAIPIGWKIGRCIKKSSICL
jgi:hypothetical protein